MSVYQKIMKVLAPPLLLSQNYLCSLTANKVLFHNQSYQNAKTQAIRFCDKKPEKQLFLYSVKTSHTLHFIKT